MHVVCAAIEHKTRVEACEINSRTTLSRTIDIRGIGMRFWFYYKFSHRKFFSQWEKSVERESEKKL